MAGGSGGKNLGQGIRKRAVQRQDGTWRVQLDLLRPWACHCLPSQSVKGGKISREPTSASVIRLLV